MWRHWHQQWRISVVARGMTRDSNIKNQCMTASVTSIAPLTTCKHGAHRDERGHAHTHKHGIQHGVEKIKRMRSLRCMLMYCAHRAYACRASRAAQRASANINISRHGA